MREQIARVSKILGLILFLMLCLACDQKDQTAAHTQSPNWAVLTESSLRLNPGYEALPQDMNSVRIINRATGGSIAQASCNCGPPSIEVV